jgi:hypothetical protein
MITTKQNSSRTLTQAKRGLTPKPRRTVEERIAEASRADCTAASSVVFHSRSAERATNDRDHMRQLQEFQGAAKVREAAAVRERTEAILTACKATIDGIAYAIGINDNRFVLHLLDRLEVKDAIPLRIAQRREGRGLYAVEITLNPSGE